MGGSDYQMVLVERISIVENASTTEYRMLLQNFETKHEDLLKEPDFYRYTFAYITEVFRNSYGSEKYSPPFEAHLQFILCLGIKSKYLHSPLSADTEKLHKYGRDIMTARGIINCLYRETKTFCDCMKPYKIDAVGMDKLGSCYGCRKKVSKTQLKF